MSLGRDVLPGHVQQVRVGQPALAQLVAVPDALPARALLGRDALPGHVQQVRVVQPALAQLVAVPDVLPARARPVAAQAGRQVARVLLRVLRAWRARL